MARVNFPPGLVGDENLPRTRRDLQNCWNTGEGRIIGRPGIRELNTTGFVARGQFEWNGDLYQVTSTNLIKITDPDTGAFTVIGDIEGTANIQTAIGFNEAVIVSPGQFIYTLDDADVIVDISNNANFVPCIDVAHINGRFVYIPFDGDPAFFSDVGAAGTVQVLSFFDAEELPDKNNSVFNFKNTLYIGGTDSFELFRDTGASPNPFIRITGSRILNGYISGLLEYKDTFLFLGRETDQDFGIYAIGQGSAVKLSNQRIDLILSTYTQGELELAISGRFKWRGYDVATFALNRHSFAFYAGNWFSLDTVFNGISKVWGAGFITQFNNKYYTAFDNKIGVFDAVNTDYGNPITRIIDAAFEHPDDDHFSCQEINLGISQGYVGEYLDTPQTVALFVSRDNVNYGQGLYRDLGIIGEHNRQLKWNISGGLGNYNGFMGIRIYTTEDVDFSASYLIASLR